jgi:hypothetical protein
VTVNRERSAIAGYPGMGRLAIVVPGASYAVVFRDAAYGSCRTYAKRTERVSHRSLDGAEARAAHRLHRPSSSIVIKNENNRRTVGAT